MLRLETTWYNWSSGLWAAYNKCLSVGVCLSMVLDWQGSWAWILTGLPCSLCSPGSTVTGPVAKECADLWPRIASNAPSIAWGDRSCVGMLIMHSVICNVMLKYTFTKKFTPYILWISGWCISTECNIQLSNHIWWASQLCWMWLINFHFWTGGNWVAAQSREWAWNEIASYSVHKKTWLSEGVQTACGIHFAAEVE